MFLILSSFVTFYLEIKTRFSSCKGGERFTLLNLALGACGKLNGFGDNNP